MPEHPALQPRETVESADDCGRECCIIDTGALINFCRIELGGRLAIEWVLQDFCVLIPKKIFDEGCPYASFQSYAHLYFSTIKTYVRPVTETCEVIIDDIIESLPQGQRTLIDDGERMGAAFAFEMSRQQVQYVVFITNDFKATPPLTKMFDLMQVGMLRDAYDILVFLASRHPNEIPLGQLDVALRDLNSIVRDSSKPAAAETQVPDEILLRHLQNINQFRDAFADY
jgi:hypothetical protein